MNLAHAIGEDRCTIYTQDISQKSSSLLRLNLVLNNLVHSIQNVIQGNSMMAPYHRTGDQLMKFDYIVSNPPFKLDFSDYREDLDAKQNQPRFFAGIPNVPKKDKDKMAIYLLFIQHIMHSLTDKGRAVIVVPTGFITAQSGIEKKIREKLVADKMLRGVVSMPSNIFATTGTNVSVLFLDKANKKGDIVLMDALTEKQSDIEQLGQGSTGQTELSRDNLGKLILILPSDKLQTAFENIIKPQFKKMAINEQENKKLAELRDWLLPMLMNGQVKVREAESIIPNW